MESVLRETGTHTLGEYIGRRKTTVAEWMELCPIYEVYGKETGYREGGRLRETWWRKTAPREQLRATMENISMADRERRQESVSGSESRIQKYDFSTLGR